MIKDLWVKYKSIIAYLFWGVVTTVVNLAVFQILSSGIHWNYQVANIIAWFLSVLVAYFTNKVWVFGSHYTTVSDFIVEFLRFYFYRGLTLVLDIIIMYVGVSLLGFNDPLQQFIVKFIDNVIVVIANYILQINKINGSVKVSFCRPVYCCDKYFSTILRIFSLACPSPNGTSACSICRYFFSSFNNSKTAC